MFVIDYHNIKQCYTLNIKFFEFVEKDLFLEEIEYLKYRCKFIKFDSVFKEWIVFFYQLQEVIQWFEKDNKEYIFESEIAEDTFNKDSNKLPEIQYFRDCSIDYSIINFKYTLYEYQKKGIEFALSKDKAMNSDDAGLGKTIQALVTFGTLYNKNKVDKIIIVVKNMLQYQWKYEILDVLNIFKEDDIALINNSNKIKPFESFVDKKIIIIPNHLLAEIFASYKKGYTSKTNLKKVRWKSFFDLRKILKCRKICLIIDESHEFKNLSANRTRAMQSHIDNFDFVYPYSATPAINYFEDWFSQMYLLDRHILNYSFLSFKVFISKTIGSKFSMYDIGAYDEDKILEVRKKINPFVIKRLKSELPEVKTKQIIRPIRLELSKKEEILYKAFLQNEIFKLEDEFNFLTFKLIFQKFPYLLMILDCPMLLKDKVHSSEVDKILKSFKFTDSHKVQYLKSFVDGLSEKIIIFSTHPNTLNNLSGLLKKHNPIIIHGELGQSQEERHELVNRFNDKASDNKIFLLSTSVGGVGLNLNKDCRREIFFDLPYDATLGKQAMNRTDRINSLEDSIIDILLYTQSIDMIRYEKVVNRLKLNDSFLNKKLTKEELKKILLGII